MRKPADQDERHGDDREPRPCSARAPSTRAKVNASAPATTRHATVIDVDPSRRDVAVEIVLRLGAARAERGDEPAEHRPGEPRQRVDRRHGDRAGADEPHLRAPDRRRVRGEVAYPRPRAAIDVSHGTATPHEMMSPSSIAMPTDETDEMARRRAARATRRCCSRSTRSRRAGRSRSARRRRCASRSGSRAPPMRRSRG